MTCTINRRGVVRGALAILGQAEMGHALAQDEPTVVLRRGVNTWPWFTLTRDYPPPRTDYAWPPYQEQRPVPTPRDLRTLHSAGFDFLRIPVDPGPFLAFTGTRRVRLFEMLFAAVAGALETGLSVVINIQANQSTHYWSPKRMYASREAPAFMQYLGLVQAVAGGLKRFNPRSVALEPVNEPPQGCDSAVWSAVQTDLLTIARREAPNLTLVASGGCGSMVPGMLALDPAPLLAIRPLLFTFHFYEPYVFSHQGATWMRDPWYRDLNSVPWPATQGSPDKTLAAVLARMTRNAGEGEARRSAEYHEIGRVVHDYFVGNPGRSLVQNRLHQVDAWAQRHEIPAGRILMGEFGALRTGGAVVGPTDADRARYVRDVRESAEALGFAWAFWCLFDSMGLMDDSTHALDQSIIAALGLSIPPA